MAAPHLRMYSNITNVHTIYTGNAVYMAHTYPSKLASACKQNPREAQGSAFFLGVIRELKK